MWSPTVNRRGWSGERERPPFGLEWSTAAKKKGEIVAVLTSMDMGLTSKPKFSCLSDLTVDAIPIPNNMSDNRDKDTYMIWHECISLISYTGSCRTVHGSWLLLYQHPLLMWSGYFALFKVVIIIISQCNVSAGCVRHYTFPLPLSLPSQWPCYGKYTTNMGVSGGWLLGYLAVVPQSMLQWPFEETPVVPWWN